MSKSDGVKTNSPLKIDRLLNTRFNLSTDILFLDVMNNLVLNPLASKSVENHSGSRVIICDPICYNLILKLNKLLTKEHLLSDDQNFSNILYKKPFKYTAILLLSDVINLFEVQKKPLLFRRYDPELKRNSYSFNYSLVRLAFPHLKVSDLVMLMVDRVNIKFGSINVNGTRPYLIIQMLNHFARSNILIEVKNIYEDLAIPHQSYNNVLLIKWPKESEADKSLKDRVDPNRKLNVGYMVFMASQLIKLSDKLKLHLISITHRTLDLHGQTRAFSQFVANKSLNFPKHHITGARVLVMDRYTDVHKLALDLQQTLLAYEANELDFENDYSSLRLSHKDQAKGDCLILVMIGPLSEQEIDSLKLIEKRWQVEKKSIKELYIFTSGIMKPDELSKV